MTQLLDWTRKNKVVNQPKVDKVKHKPAKENRKGVRLQKKNEQNQEPWAFDEGKEEDENSDDESRPEQKLEKEQAQREVDEDGDDEIRLPKRIEKERARREIREDEKEDEEGDVDCEARLQKIIDLTPCSFPLDRDEDDDTDFMLIDDNADPDGIASAFLLILGILLIWLSGYSSSINLASMAC